MYNIYKSFRKEYAFGKLSENVGFKSVHAQMRAAEKRLAWISSHKMAQEQ